MKRNALLIATLLLLTGLSFALVVIFSPHATGRISGKVANAVTGEGIPGATISLYKDKELKTNIATDLDGKYTLSVEAGTYRVEAAAIGYEKKITANIIVTADKELINNIVLTTKATTDSIKIVTDKIYEVESDLVAPASTKVKTATVAAESYTMDYREAPASVTSAPDVTLSESRAIKTSKTKEAGRSIKGKSSRYDTDDAGSDEKDKTTTKDEKTIREPDTRAGQLTAGEWSDNRNWTYFKDVLKKGDWKEMETKWGLSMKQRYYVKVTSGGKPQNDVKVQLKNKKGTLIYEGRSDNNGDCYLFAGLVNKDDNDGATIDVATAGGTKTISAPEANNIRPTTVDITRNTKTATKLDILFMIDATGSMGDEMNYLKEELSDVVRRIKVTNEQAIDIRLSTNVYRDYGDEYVVRSFPFTSDVSKVLSDLNAQSAGGGGDFEEAVEVGLDDAVNNHAWSEDATARLLFLVLDAPPHNNPANNEKIQKAVLAAAKKGIRIIPITSSGINKDTEFLMRFMSAATGGSYVFLTDDSGIGGSHIEPTIGKYDVEYLNNLLVRLISAYLTTES